MIRETRTLTVKPLPGASGLVLVGKVIADTEEELDQVLFQNVWRGKITQLRDGMWSLSIRTLPKYWNALRKEIDGYLKAVAK